MREASDVIKDGCQNFSLIKFYHILDSTSCLNLINLYFVCVNGCLDYPAQEPP